VGLDHGGVIARSGSQGKAHFRLRGLAWPVGSLTPQDDSTEFQFFILFLLSVQHFLVAPHVGAQPARLPGARGSRSDPLPYDLLAPSGWA